MERLGIEPLSVMGLPPVSFVNLAADLGLNYIAIAMSAMPNPYGYPPFSLMDDASLRRQTIAAMRDRGVSISLGDGFVVREGVDMRDRVIKRLDRLGREGALVVEDRARDHHRQADVVLLEEAVDGGQAGLHHECVERRLGEQDVDAAGDQAANLLVVGGFQLVESDVAATGVLDVNAH